MFHSPGNTYAHVASNLASLHCLKIHLSNLISDYLYLQISKWIYVLSLALIFNGKLNGVVSVCLTVINVTSSLFSLCYQVSVAVPV